jgi:hypothetical protein
VRGRSTGERVCVKEESTREREEHGEEDQARPSSLVALPQASGEREREEVRGRCFGRKKGKKKKVRMRP